MRAAKVSLLKTAGAGRTRLSRRVCRACQHFADRCREVIQSRAGNDDCIAPAVGLFRDPQELSAVIFPELHVKVLTLYLKLFRLYDVVHLKAQIVLSSPETMEELFWFKTAPLTTYSHRLCAVDYVKSQCFARTRFGPFT